MTGHEFGSAADGEVSARPPRTDGSPGLALQNAWRQERTTVLATIARGLGDLQKAEDAVQEAFATAAARWPTDGIPDRPGAWLTTIAWRKAVDALRAGRFPLPSNADTPAVHQVPGVIDARVDGDPVDPDIDDDVLSLILTCCHPALASEAQIALTLRHVAGLTDRQISARFLVAEPTMTKRLVRARAKIRDAKIAFELPDRTRLAERLLEVHTVIYLIFTEGYLTSGEGPSVRGELCDEAIWLARQLHRLAPDDPETTGLLALLLLQHARAGARQDSEGGLVLYAEQDRSRWDDESIQEAKALLSTTGRSRPGVYQLQAAIALLHCIAPAPEKINWPGIADLYAALARLQPSAIVDVNRAVAIGRVDGPRAGLTALANALHDPRLADYPPLHAAHADLLERAGDPAAIDAWTRAANLTTDPAQREQLQRRVEAAAQRFHA